MTPDPWSPPLHLTGEGLVLREWADDDVADMPGLFESPDVARFTPMPSPFDESAARDYLASGRRERSDGRRLRLAITRDGGRALGEVLLIRDADEPGTLDLGYVVGHAHRGDRLASRALSVLGDFALREQAIRRLRLWIQPSNEASNAVARRAGFALVPGPLRTVALRGRPVSLREWIRDADAPLLGDE